MIMPLSRVLCSHFAYFCLAFFVLVQQSQGQVLYGPPSFYYGAQGVTLTGSFVGYSYSLTLYGYATQDTGTLIGSFQSWITTGGNYSYMSYTGGTCGCVIGGNSFCRKANVFVEQNCTQGAGTTLINVVESPLCTYNFYVTSPLACGTNIVVPSFDIAPCPFIVTPANGAWGPYQNFNVGTQLTIHCNAGYFASVSSITCQANSMWSTSSYDCFPNSVSPVLLGPDYFHAHANGLTLTGTFSGHAYSIVLYGGTIQDTVDSIGTFSTWVMTGSNYSYMEYVGGTCGCPDGCRKSFVFVTPTCDQTVGTVLTNIVESPQCAYSIFVTSSLACGLGIAVPVSDIPTCPFLPPPINGHFVPSPLYTVGSSVSIYCNIIGYWSTVSSLTCGPNSQWTPAGVDYACYNLYPTQPPTPPPFDPATCGSYASSCSACTDTPICGYCSPTPDSPGACYAGSIDGPVPPSDYPSPSSSASPSTSFPLPPTPSAATPQCAPGSGWVWFSSACSGDNANATATTTTTVGPTQQFPTPSFYPLPPTTPTQRLVVPTGTTEFGPPAFYIAARFLTLSGTFDGHGYRVSLYGYASVDFYEMGSYAQWIMSGGNYSYMQLSFGSCGCSNNACRSGKVFVEPACGAHETIITNVIESPLCTYNIYVSSPLACGLNIVVPPNDIAPCPFLPVPGHGSWVGSPSAPIFPGTRLNITCDAGYVWQTPSIRCLPNSEWSTSVYDCVPAPNATAPPTAQYGPAAFHNLANNLVLSGYFGDHYYLLSLFGSAFQDEQFSLGTFTEFVQEGGNFVYMSLSGGTCGCPSGCRKSRVYIQPTCAQGATTTLTSVVESPECTFSFYVTSNLACGLNIVVPTNDIATCPFLAAPANGQFASPPTYAVGSVVSIVCNAGYASIATSLTCGSDSTWSFSSYAGSYDCYLISSIGYVNLGNGVLCSVNGGASPPYSSYYGIDATTCLSQCTSDSQCSGYSYSASVCINYQVTNVPLDEPAAGQMMQGAQCWAKTASPSGGPCSAPSVNSCSSCIQQSSCGYCLNAYNQGVCVPGTSSGPISSSPCAPIGYNSPWAWTSCSQFPSPTGYYTTGYYTTAFPPTSSAAPDVNFLSPSPSLYESISSVSFMLLFTSPFSYTPSAVTRALSQVTGVPLYRMQESFVGSTNSAGEWGVSVTMLGADSVNSASASTAMSEMLSMLADPFSRLRSNPVFIGYASVTDVQYTCNNGVHTPSLNECTAKAQNTNVTGYIVGIVVVVLIVVVLMTVVIVMCVRRRRERKQMQEREAALPQVEGGPVEMSVRSEGGAGVGGASNEGRAFEGNHEHQGAVFLKLNESEDI